MAGTRPAVPDLMLGHRIGENSSSSSAWGRLGQALAAGRGHLALQIHYHNSHPVAPRIADELGATYWDSPTSAAGWTSSRCLSAHARTGICCRRGRLKLIAKDAYIVNTRAAR